MKMWAEETLGELCSLITDGKHGDCRNEDDSGYYFISCKDVREGRIHYENSRQIVHGDFAETHRRTDLGPGDVLLTNSGTIGRLAIAPDDEKTQRTTFQKSVAILKPLPERITSHFLYYSLAANRARLINSAGGAAQKNLLLGELRRFTIRVPPLAEQAKIASTLSAYDDLIENNRRRIQLLEQVARLLYKEWFVHLRFPGHEHVKIKDGVPEGWENGTVADFFDTTSGGTPSRKRPEFFEGDTNWVKTQELNEDFIFETEEKITTEALSKSSAKLFPSGTLLVSIYGGTNIGRTGILEMPSASNQACVALFPRHPFSNFIFAQLFFQNIRETLIGIAQGSAQTNISQQILRKVPMLMPSKTLMQNFLAALAPVYDQLKNLKLQNMRLEESRDLLLPRLMNGAVAV
jgi:type I restriction enzyme S subunit